MAVLVYTGTAEARHAMETRPQGNPQMMALIEKMKQRLPAPEAPDCEGKLCPGLLYLWYYCCDYNYYACCGAGSLYICQPDASTC